MQGLVLRMVEDGGRLKVWAQVKTSIPPSMPVVNYTPISEPILRSRLCIAPESARDGLRGVLRAWWEELRLTRLEGMS
jgi:hypothetical protein